MIDELIEKYLKLREKKAELKNEYEAQTSKIDTAMSRIETVILSKLNETGASSLRTNAGTAMRSSVTSATVADWDMFIDYVRSNELWNMLDRRCNKTAVQEFRSTNDDLPPGVNWREESVVRIRRAS